MVSQVLEVGMVSYYSHLDEDSHSTHFVNKTLMEEHF